jgi:hypothetical protein
MILSEAVVSLMTLIVLSLACGMTFYNYRMSMSLRSRVDRLDVLREKRTAETLMLSVELTPEFASVLEHIEEVTGEGLDEVLPKAIALYRLSVDAHKAGKKIGVLDENFGLEREVVGFEHHLAS